MRFCWLALFVSAHLWAAEPGVNDPFTTRAHAEGWSVLDFLEGSMSALNWVDEADAYVEVVHASEGFDFLLAEGLAAPEFVGDYSSGQGIDGWAFDLFIGNPELVDSVSMTFFSEDLGAFVFSEPFLGEEFPEAGWYELDFFFDSQWFVFNEETMVTEEVVLDDVILGDLSEVAVSVFLNEGNRRSGRFGLDNFRTMPVISEPMLEIEIEGGNVELGFSTEEVALYDLEKYNLLNQVWEVIDGENDIVGDGERYETSVPVVSSPEIFRVSAEAAYVDLVWPQG